MFILKRFAGARYDRLEAIVDSLSGHLTGYINLIGSATLPFPVVGDAGSLPLTSVRVEGHLGQRYFPGTEPFDLTEALIEQETRRLFGIDDTYGVSGQPHSATQANHAAIRCVLSEDRVQRVAALRSTDGGHISHHFGIPRPHEFVPLDLLAPDPDYSKLRETIVKAQPSLIILGSTSLTRGIDYRRFAEMSAEVGAHLHADLAHMAPFVASGLHPPAFPHVDSATIDLSKNMRGAGGGILVFRRNVERAMRRAIFPIQQSSPNQHGLMTKAACLLSWTNDELAEYARRLVGAARLLSNGLEPAVGSPVFGQTESHLLLLDISESQVTGREAEEFLERARILVNRNQIPEDPLSSWEASGIRLSSTVPVILGYSDDDVRQLGTAIVHGLQGDPRSRAEVDDLLLRHHRALVSSASERT
ncbi:hypothetical protein [Candidatus Poriferisodalis sp.]|uniref:hypothetical protein n=1 Tax=Candidatus Poriferisodalis sp. TaxID=3101277 RepID=UPI003B515EF1